MEDNAETRGPAGDGQRRCTYCFQELNEMTDPRQLPCNHIVCLTCLENDWKLDELQCRACNKEIKIGSIDKLPQLRIEPPINISRNEHLPDATQPKSEQCDICESPSPAVIFCIDCGKKICTAHKESHKHFFKETHTTIEILVFSERPSYYNNVCCPKHPEKYLQLICDKCNDVRCPLCLSTPGICMSGGLHQYQTLAGMRAVVEKEFQGSLKKISDKITELCNLEKKTWQTVDQMTEHCDQLTREVDDLTEKQVSEILKKSAELKKDIAGYQEDEMVKVQAYIKSLLDKVDSLEVTHASISSFLRTNHITSITREKTQLESQLASKVQLDTSTEFVCQELGVVKEGPNSFGTLLATKTEELDNASSIESPQNFSISTIVLEKKIKLPTERSCRLLLYNEIGELVLGTGDHITLSDINLACREPTDIDFKSSDICCVSQYKMCIYAVLSDGAVYEIFPHKMNHLKVDLFIVDNGNHLCRLCVFGDLLVVSQSHQNLLVHNIFTGVSESQTLSSVSAITSICFDHDGHLVVMDSEEERVSKLLIVEGKPPKVLWSCDGVKNGMAVCVDTYAKHRCIFVAGSDRKLHLIHAGKIIQVLTCGSFPEHEPERPEYCSIAVYGDTLVSTAYRSPFFHIFRLKP